MVKKDERRRLERATSEVERLAKFLGLSQQWGLLVEITEAKQDPAGPVAIQIDWRRHYKKATLSFNGESMDRWTSEEMEEYVLHELVHLIFAPLDDALKEDVGDSSYVYNHYHDLREGIVDQVSHYILLARDGKRRVKT